MNILISETSLIVGDALLAKLAERVPAVDWRGLDHDLKEPYARYVALLDEDLWKELGINDLSKQAAFYNAYYWILVFAKKFQGRHGFDAGVEQESIKVLEHAPDGVDWDVVERISQAARQA